MRLIERFEVIGDTGQTYMAEIYEEQVDVSHMGGRASVGGMKEAFLGDGRRLTAAADGAWRIVQTGEVVRRA